MTRPLFLLRVMNVVEEVFYTGLIYSRSNGNTSHKIFIKHIGFDVEAPTYVFEEVGNLFMNDVDVIFFIVVQTANDVDELQRGIFQRCNDRNDALLALGIKDHKQ